MKRIISVPCESRVSNPLAPFKSATSMRPSSSDNAFGEGSSKRAKPSGGKQDPRTQSRTRLTLTDKIAALKPLYDGVTHKAIGERFNMGERTIRKMRKERSQLQAVLNTNKRSIKRNRPGDFPDVRCRTLLHFGAAVGNVCMI